MRAQRARTRLDAARAAQIRAQASGLAAKYPLCGRYAGASPHRSRQRVQETRKALGSKVEHGPRKRGSSRAQRECGLPTSSGPRPRARAAFQTPGTSLGSTSPCLRHPTPRSQVWAPATSGGSRTGGGAIRRFQPSNQRADEASSSHTGGGAPWRSFQCLRAFSSNVGQGVPNLARRAQHPQVVAPVEDPPRAVEGAVHRPRQTRGHRLHAVPQRLLCRRFHQQVHVVSLDRVVNDAEIPPLARLAQTAAEDLQEAPASERGQPYADPKGHVRRAVAGHTRPPHVVDRRPLRRWLAPGPGPPPAPARQHAHVVERELLAAPHLQLDYSYDYRIVKSGPTQSGFAPDAGRPGFTPDR